MGNGSCLRLFLCLVPWRALGALLAGGVVAFATGLVDDLKEIRPRYKLLGQAAAGAILLLGGIRWFAYPHLSWLPVLHFAETSVFVLVVCLVMHFLVVIGASNATNLLDGLDGLCSGVTVTISIGFLPYNLPPARIFMGDAGSVFIGYVLAVMMIMFAGRFGMVKWFVGALFIFGLPIFDTGVALIRRLRYRRPIMMPDRSHVYNQMVDRLGLSVRATVAVLFGTSAVLAAVGLLVLYIRGRYASVIYLVAGALLLVLAWRLGFLRMTAEEKDAADRYLTRRRRR